MGVSEHNCQEYVEKVSVALCTHNGVKFLEEQLLSILNQDYSVDEIVISDDASSDGTVAFIRKFWQKQQALAGEQSPVLTGVGATRLPELLLIENKTALGVSGNFEQALRATSGSLLILSDQDDVWHVGRVSRAKAIFDADSNVMLVAANAEMIDETGEKIPKNNSSLHSYKNTYNQNSVFGITLFETIKINSSILTRLNKNSQSAAAELFRRNLLTGATMMIRRELLEIATPFPSAWVHDEWLAIIAVLSGKQIVVLSDPIINYRQHNSNQIGATQINMRGRMSRLQSSRAERNLRLLQRSKALWERAPEDYKSKALEKFIHEQRRSALPEKRLKRILPIIREMNSGRYSEYGLGIQDVFRDILQPT